MGCGAVAGLLRHQIVHHLGFKKSENLTRKRENRIFFAEH